MLLDNFRLKLRQEAQLWRDEGVINIAQYQQIGERYQFESLDNAVENRFILMMMILGSILLGLGVVTFIAANWEVWTREAKVVLLLSILFTTNIIGFNLWQQSILAAIKAKPIQRRKQFLGQGLLILGALLLGIILSLMTQLFHTNNSSYELFLLWSGGVVIMASSLRLSSLAVIAIILVLIGYFTGLSELRYAVNEISWGQLVVEHIPLLLWVVFVPLAILCKSRWVFALAAIALAISLNLQVNPAKYLSQGSSYSLVATLALTLPPSLLWSYDDLLFLQVNHRKFQPLARNLTLVFFGIVFYLYSFSWYWQPSSLRLSTTSTPNFAAFIDVAFLSVIALSQWLFLILRGLSSMHIIILGWIALVGFIPFWSYFNIDSIVPIALYNTLLGIMAIGLIRHGFEYKQRSIFWVGVSILALQILSRILEYNTDLLSKSLAFSCCGIFVIIAGLWFEK